MVWKNPALPEKLVLQPLSEAYGFEDKYIAAIEKVLPYERGLVLRFVARIADWCEVQLGGVEFSSRYFDQ
jgi:hypothetical protein